MGGKIKMYRRLWIQKNYRNKRARLHSGRQKKTFALQHRCWSHTSKCAAPRREIKNGVSLVMSKTSVVKEATSLVLLLVARGHSVWCFIVQPLPSVDYMQLWHTRLFSDNFPTIKAEGLLIFFFFFFTVAMELRDRRGRPSVFLSTWFTALGNAQALPLFICFSSWG